MAETSAEAGRTKAGNAIRPVRNLRLFTLPPDVNLSNSAFWIENPRRFVHAGSLEFEQPRRIVGEDAPSHPVIGTHSPGKITTLSGRFVACNRVLLRPVKIFVEGISAL